MSAQLSEIWQKTMSLLKNELTEISFNTWIKTIEPLSLTSNTINLGVPAEFNKGILDLPMIRRLTEYRMVMTKIPASKLLIFSLVFKMPVVAPAIDPTAMATSIAYGGGQPMTNSLAATAPPSPKLPSTVRSGNARILKLRTMPRATREYAKPCSREMGTIPLIIWMTNMLIP